MDTLREKELLNKLWNSKIHPGKYGNLCLRYTKIKVFITGHSGFKGSWLTSILIKIGAIVKGYSHLQKK